VVFVADSQPGMMEQNQESLENLKENLRAHGIDWETVPFIIQYNKRDIPGALPVEEMRRILNLGAVPDFETIATTGPGVMEAMKAICRMVLEDIQRKQQKASGAKVAPSPRPAAPAEKTEAPAPRVAPVPEVAPLPAARPAGVERSIHVPIVGPGSPNVFLGVPLEFQWRFE
jgi:hypothetical protein